MKDVAEPAVVSVTTVSHVMNETRYVAPRTFGSLHADGLTNFEFSMIKNTRLTERLNLQFRGEFFNLFNTAQFGPPNTSLNTPNFGVVTNQLNSARIIHLALKLLF